MIKKVAEKSADLFYETTYTERVRSVDEGEKLNSTILSVGQK